MDIITHTLSGVAAGTVIANVRQANLKMRVLITAFAALGGAIPDIDVISMWSGFDSTFGEFFNLKLSGREIYSAKLWYSHHSFCHSLLGGLLFSLIAILSLHTGRKIYHFKKTKSFKNTISKYRYVVIAFFVAFIIHISEDMVTPSSGWGGVNLFWPLNYYIGGWGYTWWWNNYDIFLLIVILLSFNLILVPFSMVYGFKMKLTSLISSLVIFFLIAFQIFNRDYNYNSNSVAFHEHEHHSFMQQQEILGDAIFLKMRWLDKKIPVYF
ncbi:MAG: metal-dependent hydrolase [Bacteroidales bacterium]|nr:metal-dependent hydrolase [Bacteroidales bacterium]